MRWPSVRRPEVDDLDAVGSRGDELEVLLDVVGGRELAVGAHPKAEVRFGRRNLGGRDRRDASSDARNRQGADREKLHRRMIAERRRRF